MVNKAPVWSYQEKQDLSHWAELTAENASCSAARQQSPIALNTNKVVHSIARKFTFNYQKPTKAKLLNIEGPDLTS
jgi:carbonic anhydrase